MYKRQGKTEGRGEIDPEFVFEEILQSAEISIKYKGYIEREKGIADKIRRLENLRIPDNFDFTKAVSYTHLTGKELELTITRMTSFHQLTPVSYTHLDVYKRQEYRGENG